jgi:hypothetical protein
MIGNGHVRFGGGPRGKGPVTGYLAAWPTLRCIALSLVSRRCKSHTYRKDA